MAHDHCHCRDYTRSQLLRAAAAEAGKGLPAIEAGMPTPGRHRALAAQASSRGAPAWRWPSTAPPRSRWRPSRTGSPRRPPRDKSARLDLLRRRHRLAQRPRAGQRPDLRRACGRPSASTSATPAPPPSPRTRASSGIPRPPACATLHGEDKVTVFPAIGYDEPEPVALHLAPLLRDRRGAGRLPTPAGSAATSTRSATTTTRSRALSLTASSRRCSPPPSKPVAAVDRRRPTTTSGPTRAATRSRRTCSAASATSARFRSDSPALTQTRRATGQTEQLREQLDGFGNFTSPVAYPVNNGLSDQLSGLAAMLGAGLPVQVATMPRRRGLRHPRERGRATLPST